MKRFLFYGFVGTFAAIAGLLLTWFAVPSVPAWMILKLNNASAGLSERSVMTDIGPVHYLEGGRGETVVLLHGIYARKEHWVEVARHLVKDYHVIALDLPGFGDNAALEIDQYTLENQQSNLALVFEALDLKRVHIAANSMGAHVAALHVTAQPDSVATSAFIGSPLGVASPIKSDMDIALAKGRIPLLVKSSDDFYARNAWLSPSPLKLPSPILRVWMKKELEQVSQNEAIWHAVHDGAKPPNLLALAPAIEAETLIIWCEPDRVFHISGAQVLADELRRASLKTMKQCGHVPMIDRPVDVAETYRAFLQRNAAQ